MKNSVQKCLLYFEAGTVTGYLWENTAFEKISMYENFSPDYTSEMWKWWIGATSYLISREEMDVCLLAESRELAKALLDSAQEASISFVEHSSWQVSQLEQFMTDFYPSSNYVLYGKVDAEKLEISSRKMYSDREPMKKYIGMIKKSIFNSEEKISACTNEENCLEKGILYKKFNELTSTPSIKQSK